LLIARLTLRDPSEVKLADIFKGTAPKERSSPPLTSAASPLYALRFAKGILQRCIGGFVVQQALAESAVEYVLQACNDPRLPAEEMTETLSVLSGRIPEDLHVSFTKATASLVAGDIDAWKLLSVVNDTIQTHKDFASLSEAEETSLDVALQLITTCTIAAQYECGPAGRALLEFLPLLRAYYEVEKEFDKNNSEIEEAVRILREARGEDDLRAVYSEVLSHNSLAQKNKLILALLKKLPSVTSEATGERLQRMRSEALRNLCIHTVNN